MSVGHWYLAIASLAIGAGMVGYWAIALGIGRVPEVAQGSREIWWHISAELASGGLLIIGGIGILADPTAGWVTSVSYFGLGTLLYALVGAPGRYLEKGDRVTLLLLAGTWAVAIPAFVLRFTLD